MWSRTDTMAVLLPVILAGWLIHTSEGFSGISSFGRVQTDAPKPSTPAPTPARQCSRQVDCSAVPSSSCVRTLYDSQTRCLCGDNSPPINGQCEAQTKTLHHSCANSEECNDGLICGTPNATGGLPPHLRMLGSKDIICLCDVENGFREKDFTCSDADILKTSLIAILIVTCLRKMLVY